MISLIICSRHSDVPQKLKDNIKKTIGVEYELIVIDNSSKKYSIFSAYNKGVSLAKFPLICFMHEDILFETKDWGIKVINHFSNNEVGCIGVIGGHLIPNTPSGWMHAGLVSGKTIKFDNSLICDLSRFNFEKSLECVVVDGLWFCIPASLFKSIRFDDITFKGFHCYDIDICLNILKIGKKVLVTNDIVIKHFSDGNWNQSWVDETKTLFNKWSNILPIYAGVDLDEKEVQIRTEMASEIFSWITNYAYSQMQIENIRKSVSYKLGKFLLKPLKKILKLTQ